MFTVEEMKIRWAGITTPEALQEWEQLHKTLKDLEPALIAEALDVQLRTIWGKDYQNNKMRIDKGVLALMINDALASCVPPDTDLSTFSPEIQAAIGKARGRRDNLDAEMTAAREAFVRVNTAQTSVNTHTGQQQFRLGTAAASFGGACAGGGIGGLFWLDDSQASYYASNAANPTLSESPLKQTAVFLWVVAVIATLIAVYKVGKWCCNDSVIYDLVDHLANAKRDLQAPMRNLQSAMRNFNQNPNANAATTTASSTSVPVTAAAEITLPSNSESKIDAKSDAQIPKTSADAASASAIELQQLKAATRVAVERRNSNANAEIFTALPAPAVTEPSSKSIQQPSSTVAPRLNA